MEFFAQYHPYAATALARVFLGCLFFFQGYDAVIRVGIREVVVSYQRSFPYNRIPSPLVWLAAWFTGLSELLGGALLIAGLFTFPALYLMAATLVIAAIGFGANEAMWDTRHAFPRLILTITLLIMPPAWNYFSLDRLFFNQLSI